MKWTDEKIVEWHEKTFKECTIENQLLKLEHEFKEYMKEDDFHKRKLELADMYIVAVTAYYRFHSYLGKFVSEEIRMGARGKAQVFKNAVDEKMDINAARKWVRLPDGTYQHEEEK